MLASSAATLPRSHLLAEKIKAGALGKIATASGNYNAPASTEKKREGEGKDEYRLRNWLWDRALSGDILVEQNIHIIDLCNWMLGAHPLKATATGGRNVLTHYGDCWDNYQVDSRIRMTCTSLCIDAFGSDNVFEAGLKLFGASGSATVPLLRSHRITGKCVVVDSEETAPGSGQFAANGAFLDNPEFADREKERTFIASIVSGPAAQPDCRGSADRVELHAGAHGRISEARS